MIERHIRASFVMQDLGTEELAKSLARSRKITERATQKKEDDLPMLDVDLAAKVAAEGMKIERLSRGEPGDIGEQRQVPNASPSGPNYDLSQLSPDELRTIRSLVRKARK